MTTTATISTLLERLLRDVAQRMQIPQSTDLAVREHYQALARYLTNGALAPYHPNLYAQGSYRIGTTVSPIAGEDFDLDFVVELNAPGVEPGQLYEMVAGEIERNRLYQGKTERKPRCIRITYAGQFHVDVVPAIPDPNIDGTAILIPERNATGLTWRSSDPRGYVHWFDAMSRGRYPEKFTAIEPLPPQNGVAGKSALQVTVQLLKRHHQRQVNNEKLRTPSIVLTTVTALTAAGFDSLNSCLDAAVNGMMTYARTRKDVLHPTNSNEVLSDKWADDSIFHQFQACAAKLVQQWDQLLNSQGQGLHVIGGILNEMFGEEPVEQALKAIGSEAGALKKNGRLLAGTGGAIAAVERGRGNPTGTFHGDE